MRQWAKELTGRTFGRLQVIGEAVRPQDQPAKAKVLTACVCGSKMDTRVCHLLSGATRSCGCLNRELLSRRATHRMTMSTEYQIWNGMYTRCTNKRRRGYKNYGGRGITVDSRWLKFENFYADMGPRPSLKHTLDRYPDNDGPYSKANCRWATKQQQTRNTRRNYLITISGRTQCMTDWAKECGVKMGTVWQRLYRGWPAIQALGLEARTMGIHKSHERH